MTSKRSHTKSRLGCKQCKRRRIKCDEVAPCCGNCFTKGIACEYQHWQGACDNMLLLTPATYGRRASPNAESTKHSPPGSTPSASSSVSTGAASTSSGAFSLEDLGLLHYFTLHTSLAVGQQDNDTSRWVWQSEVPRLAQTNQFLMHALLSCAAADRAQSEGRGTEDSDWDLARSHYDQSIALFREAVENVNAENADALLCFCILVMLMTVCLDAHRPAEQHAPIETFINLMQTVHRSIGMLNLVKDDLRLSVIGASLLPAKADGHVQPLEDDVANALGLLGSLTARYNMATNNANAENLADALTKLHKFYSLAQSKSVDCNRVLLWVVELDGGFERLLREGNPIALCMVAHWCVTLCNAPLRWHTGTWPQALMLSISQRLQGTQWAEGMTWPLNAAGQDQQMFFPDMADEFDTGNVACGFQGSQDLSWPVFNPEP